VDADALEAAARQLAERCQGRVGRDLPLAPMTTFRLGGPAALFLRAEGDADLVALGEVLAATRLPLLVVGRGSNLLVADAGWPGVVLHLGQRFRRVEVDGTELEAGAAMPLPGLAARSAAASLGGMAFAVAIPGTVGGGVRMNAGGHGSDIAATLTRAWLFDLAGAGPGGAVEVAAGDLDLGYRHSSIGPTQVVVAAEFALTPGDRAEAEAEIAAVVKWRREHQPGGSNAGSVFANPPGDSAGRLIDAAGLRGHRRASAFVSPKHANFFQVDPGGSADDVRDLMEEVRMTVENRFGIVLTLENRLIGFDLSPSSRG
jgi:UDP-N-acetylmuramate dehydrogenase